jgi:predicted naringenin-chalcone synthase
MTAVRLQGLGRAVPDRQVAQQALLAHSPWPMTPLLAKLFLESDVHTRGFMVPPSFFLDRGASAGRTLTETNAAWLQGAMALGRHALTDLLASTATPATSVDLLAVTTVTGYATPGLDLLLARDLGLRRDIARAHFNNIGCHAAIPLLKVARDHVLARPDSLAVAGAVEVCSACFRDTDDAQNLVATSLFGDGAAFALLGTGGDGPVLRDFGAVYDYDHLDALGFGLDQHGFAIVLDPSIPDIIARHIGAAVDALLARNDATREDVVRWAFHPGGARILDAVQDRLTLSDADLRPSRRVLRAHGNMSSPSVLFSLAEGFRAEGVPSDGLGVMAAFGPGLGIEVALLDFGG